MGTNGVPGAAPTPDSLVGHPRASALTPRWLTSCTSTRGRSSRSHPARGRRGILSVPTLFPHTWTPSSASLPPNLGRGQQAPQAAAGFVQPRPHSVQLCPPAQSLSHKGPLPANGLSPAGSQEGEGAPADGQLLTPLLRLPQHTRAVTASHVTNTQSADPVPGSGPALHNGGSPDPPHDQ